MTGSHEVTGSIPVGSTKKEAFEPLSAFCFAKFQADNSRLRHHELMKSALFFGNWEKLILPNRA